jgi:hypothetical protein
MNAKIIAAALSALSTATTEETQDIARALMQIEGKAYHPTLDCVDEKRYQLKQMG